MVGIEHIGSAHDDARLAVLTEVARQRLHAGQDELDFGLAVPAGGARIVAMDSRVLWDLLAGAYSRVGFDLVADDAFRARGRGPQDQELPHFCTKDPDLCLSLRAAPSAFGGRLSRPAKRGSTRATWAQSVTWGRLFVAFLKCFVHDRTLFDQPSV